MSDRALDVVPLTPERFADFEALLGPHGGDGGCWCMFWRQKGSDHAANAGDGNRAAMRRLVAEGDPPPGLLAYRDGTPVGWISAGPRADFGRITRSSRYKPAAEDPGRERVWSVVCFYIAAEARGAGIASALLAAVVDHARAHGAELVEGYPHDTGGERVAPVNVYTGVPRLFEQAGFTEVERRKPRSPIVRRDLSSSP